MCSCNRAESCASWARCMLLATAPRIRYLTLFHVTGSRGLTVVTDERSIGPFYVVPMQGGVKCQTQGLVGEVETFCLYNLIKIYQYSAFEKKTPVLEGTSTK